MTWDKLLGDLRWEDLLSREVPDPGQENGGLFRANNTSSILPGANPTKHAQSVWLETEQCSLQQLDSAKSRNVASFPSFGSIRHRESTLNRGQRAASPRCWGKNATHCTFSDR